MMYEAGVKAYSDAIGVHPSGYNNPPGADWRTYQDPTASFGAKGHRSWFFRGTIEGYREVMVEFGDEGKQLWATEFGWASDPSPPEEQMRPRQHEAEQATWLARPSTCSGKGTSAPCSLEPETSNARLRQAFAVLRPTGRAAAYRELLNKRASG
jgi:hypothetical protein